MWKMGDLGCVSGRTWVQAGDGFARWGREGLSGFLSRPLWAIAIWRLYGLGFSSTLSACPKPTEDGGRDSCPLGTTASSSTSPQRWGEAGKDFPAPGRMMSSALADQTWGTGADPAVRETGWRAPGEGTAQRSVTAARLRLRYRRTLGKNKPNLGEQMEGRQQSQGSAGH